MATIQDTEKYRDKIATVDEQGKRIWIYPTKPKGRFYQARTYVSWMLLAILFGLPFIKVRGEPLVLFNVLERNFILFGIHFTPQDFHLFVLAMLTLLVFIVLFTVIYGRLFCGWVCPQTIFMEMVFRKIEYWIEGDAPAQRRLNKAPWTTDKFLKKGGKHALFLLLSILIAHTFLSYVIGIEQVTEIVTHSPSQNWGGFFSMIAFTGIFYFVFSRLREQVCTTICPYGRLQGVMTDQNTILVTYDFERGEPRGKIQKKKLNPLQNIQKEISDAALDMNGKIMLFPEKPLKIKGDCIDCGLCVRVCPTGIDIRDGVQLECVNCTACMDACDGIMDKVGRERGLIRYDSHNGVIAKQQKVFNTRVIAYTIVLVALIGLNIFLLGNRSDVEAVILRTPGMLYQKVDETYISNLYNFQVFNKTTTDIPLEFKLLSDHGRIKLVGEMPLAKGSSMAEGAFFIEMENAKLAGRKNALVIEIYSNGKLVDKVETNFLGPIK